MRMEEWDEQGHETVVMGVKENLTQFPFDARVAREPVAVQPPPRGRSPARVIERVLLTTRQSQAYGLRHFDKLSDDQAAKVMGFQGRNAVKKFNALVRRAEKQAAALRKLVQQTRGDCSLLDDLLKR